MCIRDRNKNLYGKQIAETQNNSNHKLVNKKDKKFYKRRIFDLTKQLLNNEKPKEMFPDVSSAFDLYAKICIEYFKVLDKADIMQEDYDGFTNSKNTSTNTNTSNMTDADKQAQEEMNKLLMRTIKITEPNALEKLVKRTPTKISKKPPIIPMQKDINLKDPILKNKGIRKKNNINNNYGENSEKTK